MIIVIDLVVTGIIVITGLVLIAYGCKDVMGRPALLFGLIMVLLSVDSFLIFNYRLNYVMHCLLRCSAFLLGLVLVYELVLKKTNRIKLLENKVRKIEELKNFTRMQYKQGLIAETEYKKLMLKYDEEIMKLLLEIKSLKPIKIPLLEEVTNLIFR